jgi:diamine N-acetyltransferase
MEFLVRLCRPGDEKALSLVSQAAILETYSGITDASDLYAYVTRELTVEAFRALLANDRTRTWAVETKEGKCMIGFALAVSGEGSKPFATMELVRLYVFYRFHGLGLGKRLLDAVLAHAREHKTTMMTLHVYARNVSAISFYKHYGFAIISEQPFPAGERDYRVFVMQRTLQH